MNVASILAGIARGQTNLQQNAQANLPIIPNNGNPMGANNMAAPTLPAQQMPPANTGVVPPQMQTGGQLPPDRQYAYPWMNPSPAMQAVWAMLGRRTGGPAQQQPVQQPVPMPKPMMMRGEEMDYEQPFNPRMRGMVLPQRR